VERAIVEYFGEALHVLYWKDNLCIDFEIGATTSTFGYDDSMNPFAF
jgi:aconitase A